MADSLSKIYGGRGIALDRGEGSIVWDTQGRRYIDFFNGHGAAIFGHGNKILTNALIESAAHVWSCGAGMDSDARTEVADILSGYFGDGRVFFCNSGTESVEAALKLAAALNGKRSEIIAARKSFHGRSCGALGLTFNPKYRAPFARFIPTAKHIATEDIADKITDETLAVFIEPVQGEGGVYPIAQETAEKITKTCRAHGTLLIADEVQTGMGRCGAFFASYERGLKPDIICIAKGFAGGAPAGAVVWRKALGDFPPHSHGSTYGGNELLMRVTLAALKLIEKEKLCEHAKKIGTFIKNEIAARKIPLVEEIRGEGLLIGVETKLPSQDIVKAMQSQGLLSLAAGPRVVRFMPSFAVNEEIALEAISIFEKTMKNLSEAK